LGDVEHGEGLAVAVGVVGHHVDGGGAGVLVYGDAVVAGFGNRRDLEGDGGGGGVVGGVPAVGRGHRAHLDAGVAVYQLRLVTTPVASTPVSYRALGVVRCAPGKPLIGAEPRRGRHDEHAPIPDGARQNRIAG
jgi:hypothetical protein